MHKFIQLIILLWNSRILRDFVPVIQEALAWYIKNPLTPSDERHERAAELLGKIQPINTNDSPDLPATPGGA